jgi:hypothetical protein
MAALYVMDKGKEAKVNYPAATQSVRYRLS